MSYRLTMTETPGDGLRRCAAEQLEAARDGLATATDETRAEAVHEARKSLKKTRSLLRLARPVIGGKRFKAANAALRDTGRTLSGTRDADVLMEVVDDLEERYGGDIPPAAFNTLRAGVTRAARPPASGRAEDPIAAAIRQLGAVHQDIADWPVDAATWPIVVDGLARTYARGRADLTGVEEDPAVDARHEWRKRVKDLWYQERLIVDAWEPVLTADAEQAHVLSELLGDDHDLAVLHETIATGRVDAGPQTDSILERIAHRQDELLHDALVLGRRIYAESPRAFAKRVQAYVTVWADTQKTMSAGS
ncbi:MAG: domain containing protein [Solirubrobacterales bacterium]|nr:domain containing protein [Solirubrobacterales bacterium]